MLPAVVSLFSGAGGLDRGFHQAGFEIPLAIDQSAAAVQTHKRNFPDTTSIAADLRTLGPSGVVDLALGRVPEGSQVAVIGGPPCQGFSRANTRSFSDDPRNRLPQLYLQIVKALQERFSVTFVLFENVLGIRDQKHAATFAQIMTRLRDLGLVAGVAEHAATDYGVPQRRRRVIVTGFADPLHAASYSVLATRAGTARTVRDAISGLPEPALFHPGLRPDDIPHHPNHWAMAPRSSRFSQPGGVQMGGRSFRRLAWDEPSPTVAYGHREVHVHPDGHRRLSVYEAMLLQGFPKGYILEGNLSEQIEQVSNAVPPPMASAIAAGVSRALTAAGS